MRLGFFFGEPRPMSLRERQPRVGCRGVAGSWLFGWANEEPAKAPIRAVFAKARQSQPDSFLGGEEFHGAARGHASCSCVGPPPSRSGAASPTLTPKKMEALASGSRVQTSLFFAVVARFSAFGGAHGTLSKTPSFSFAGLAQHAQHAQPAQQARLRFRVLRHAQIPGALWFLSGFLSVSVTKRSLDAPRPWSCLVAGVLDSMRMPRTARWESSV